MIGITTVVHGVNADTDWTWIAIAGGGLVSLLWIGEAPLLRRVPRFLMAVSLLVGLHQLVALHVVPETAGSAYRPALLDFVAAIWPALGLLQLMLWSQRHRAAQPGLHRWFYAGLFFDAWVTRASSPVLLQGGLE